MHGKTIGEGGSRTLAVAKRSKEASQSMSADKQTRHVPVLMLVKSPFAVSSTANTY